MMTSRFSFLAGERTMFISYFLQVSTKIRSMLYSSLIIGFCEYSIDAKSVQLESSMGSARNT